MITFWKIVIVVSMAIGGILTAYVLWNMAGWLLIPIVIFIAAMIWVDLYIERNS